MATADRLWRGLEIIVALVICGAMILFACECEDQEYEEHGFGQYVTLTLSATVCEDSEPLIANAEIQYIIGDEEYIWETAVPAAKVVQVPLGEGVYVRDMSGPDMMYCGWYHDLIPGSEAPMWMFSMDESHLFRVDYAWVPL